MVLFCGFVTRSGAAALVEVVDFQLIGLIAYSWASSEVHSAAVSGVPNAAWM